MKLISCWGNRHWTKWSHCYISEDVNLGSDKDDPIIVANLDIDDNTDALDDGVEAEAENTPACKVKRGVHQDYMRAIYARLRYEVAGKL